MVTKAHFGGLFPALEFLCGTLGTGALYDAAPAALLRRGSSSAGAALASLELAAARVGR